MRSIALRNSRTLPRPGVRQQASGGVRPEPACRSRSMRENARRAAAGRPAARATAGVPPAPRRAGRTDPRGSGRAAAPHRSGRGGWRRRSARRFRRRLAAHRRDLPLLQHAQQLCLHGEIHVADLVEEQGAAIRLAERAESGRRSAPVNDPAHMAEQLAFQQVGRDRCAIDGDERVAMRGCRSDGSSGRRPPFRCRSRR